MTRKDFREIAATIREIRDLPIRRMVADRLAEVCKRHNPRFDYRRFLKACGL